MSIAWAIYEWNSVTLEWDSIGTISRPNESINAGELQSTQERIFLADGSDAYVTPETKYIPQAITFIWYSKDQDFKDQISTYITDDTYLKIQTHIEDISFIGQFINIQPIWVVGQNPDIWDINATFEVMET